MSIALEQSGERSSLREARLPEEGEALDKGTRGLLAELLRHADSHDGVNDLFEKMTNMPWAGLFAQRGLFVLEERMKNGVDPLEAASHFHDPECFSPFSKGALVVVDLNRSSAFFHSVSDEQRSQLDSSLQAGFGALMQEMGAYLVQKPAGDQYAFYLEYGDDEKDNTARLQAFMRRLEGIRIPTGLKGRDYDRIGLNPAHYPNDHFTMATGVYECDEGDLQAGVFMGSKESAHGYNAVLGPGMSGGIELQKKAGPGKTLPCPRSEARLSKPFDESYAATPRPREPLLLNTEAPHMHAQLLTLFRTLHHPSSLEPEAKKLGTTYVCLKVGDASTVADYEQYARVAQCVFDVLEQPRFEGFSITKQDFTILHFEVDEKHRHNEELVMEFCNELLRSFKGINIPASAGVAQADAMLVTRYRNSLALDRSSSAIVEAVRCAALAPEGQIACGRSVLAAWGEQVEYDVKQLKEGPLFYALNEGEGTSTLRSKGLEGVDEVWNDLQAFCFSTPASPEVVYALGASEDLKGKGAGVSALFRQLGREVPAGFQLSPISNVGNGGYGYIRGLLQTMGFSTEGNDEVVMENFDRLLLEADWSEPRVLELDAPHLSAEEMEAYNRLVARLVGTPTKLLCADGPHVDGFKAAAPAVGKETALVKERALQELAPEAACRLLMRTRPDLNSEDHDALLVALLAVREQHPELPFTPRLVLHVYASALYRSGAQLLFDAKKLESVRAGDLGVDLKEEGISATGRRILGVLGHSRRSQWNLGSLHSFYTKVTGDVMTAADFEKEIVVLRKKYLKAEPILIALKPRYAVSAQDLFMPEDSKAFSQALLETVGYGQREEELSHDEEERVAEWHHLTKVLEEPTPRLQALTRSLVQSYLARGLRDEARRIFADYFHKGLRFSGSDKELLLDALWLFADGEDPVSWEHAKELAAPLLENPYLNAELRLEVIWRLYRIAVKENTNHTDPAVLLEMEALIAQLRGQAFVSLPTTENEKVLREQLLKALESSATFYNFKSQVLKTGQAPDGVDMLKSSLVRDRSAFEGMSIAESPLGREIGASSQRLLAGRYKQAFGNTPEAHRAAKELFASATAQFETLDGSMREDPRQKRDCRVFGNEADMYLLDHELKAALQAEPETKRALRAQTLGRLSSMFAEGLDVYRECCLKGDRLNRRAAAVHLGNLLVLDARARTLDFQPGDEERIRASIPEIRKYWAHYPSDLVEEQIKQYVTPELYSRLAM